VLSVDGPEGQPIWSAGKAKAEEVIDPRAAYQVTEIIAGNTDPKQNPVWSRILRLGNGPGGSRRPAAAKTGTTNETLDYATYGFLAPPKNPRAPGIVVGVWMGNSDHSESRGPGREIISLDGPAPVWQAFMRDYTKRMPVARFEPPEGLVRARIDAWTGGRPGSFTRQTTTALFIKGTQPGIKKAVDPTGLMYVRSCGGWRIDLTKAEPERAWRADVLGWMARARSGPGRFGRYHTATAYLPGRGSWGGSMVGSCAPPPCQVAPDGPGNGNGNGNGQSDDCTPPPSPGPTPAPSPPATAPRRRRPIKGGGRRGSGP
jgi:membrane peptidoglycan carboxypeptidase